MYSQRSIRLFIATLSISLLLSACQAGQPSQPVQPVVGLPEGTDGNPWWNDTVFYEIFVRSFADSNGDGKGDLSGLISKLDYLNDGNPETSDDLGVSGIWLMPVFPSPSYHGYDVKDYYAVNPDYGSMDDMKLLLEEAHKRGIRVIVDMVLNHTSSQHPFFIEAKSDPDSGKRSWYIWSETDPGYKGPWGQKVWYQDDSGYYYAIFDPVMPDLNHENPEASQAMYAAVGYWLDEVGVDGFRLDAVEHIIEEGQNQENTPATHAWLEDFRSYYTGVNPLALTVGEIQAKSPQVAEYTEGDELDLAFEFDLASSTLNGVNGNTANFIKDALKTTMREFKPNQFATFLTNHDIDRVATKLFHDQDKMKMAAGVLFTIPGVPFIYYGEEIGMAGAKPDPQIRTPMQWTPGDNAGFTTGTPWTSINGDYKTTNVETQSADADSLLMHYRRLIQARNQHVALRLGDYQPVEAGSTKVLSFMRSSDDEKVMVVINLGKDAIDEYSLNLKEGNLSGSYRLASIFQSGDFEPKPKLLPLQANASGGFDDFRPFEGPLPAYSISIFQLQPEG